jgi:glutamate/tyrosine decarboxylase-like PLP-dependent enzyme
MTDYRNAPRREAPLDLASVFLGPKGENADVFERLLLEAFRDHVFWRRNFHPEDGFHVTEGEKHSPDYQRAISTLSQELMGLLGELKAGVPFFSPRYIGHMTSDLTMASLIGWFATMLYNPNNVAAEASPVTTRMELEVADQLARMIGYDTETQWGHLTSGGTVANYEALWVARNVKYLPVAVRWAAEQMGIGGLAAELPDGSTAPLDRLDLWQMLNLAPTAALDLAARYRERVGDAYQAVHALAENSLEGMGFQEFGRRLTAVYGDALAPGVVLVPSTAHYSWEKICRTLGIGGAQLVHVPVDGRFRMDPAALEFGIRRLAERRQPIIACISVIGTTEESAVDRLDLLADVRERMGRELGVGFYLHADAAWGGYAASITRGADGRRRSYEDALRLRAGGVAGRGGVSRTVRHGASRFRHHRPAQAGLRALPRRCGELCGPPLARPDRGGGAVPVSPRRVGVGVHRALILEGSKPGAAAASVWMSHKVLPLDARGYGRLIGETARGARTLHRRLSAGDWAPFRVVPLPAPDLNLVCFAVGHPELRTLEETNDFVARVYGAMSVSDARSARMLDYFVTKTELRQPEYGDAAVPLVEALGFSREDYHRAGALAVIRCTVMDPYLGGGRSGVDYVGGFARTLRAVFEAELRG